METDSSWDEDFVLELSHEHDELIDENDNYKYEQTITEQPVDTATPSDLDNDRKLHEKIKVKSETKYPFINQNQNPHKRQTTISEYYSMLPSNASPTVKHDNAHQKTMVNVSLLLSQLLNARVVLNRLSNDEIVKYQSSAYKTSVQRYCYKCKTLNVDHRNIIMPKNCSECGSLLLYVCEKCNENHYLRYKSLRKHSARCNGEKTGKSLDDVCLMYCAECPFKTSYQYVMAKHLKHANHKTLDNPKLTVSVTSVQSNQAQITPSNFIVEQSDIDFKKARQRYCPRCQKTIASSSSKNDDTCNTCNTILLYQCSKCNKQCISYKSLYRHFKIKCYPSIYRCPKCKFTVSSWKRMDCHLKKLCKLSSIACSRL